MKLINVELGDGKFIADKFEFDDGTEIYLKHTNLTLKHILILSFLCNDKTLHFSYSEKSIKTDDYSQVMDYVNFILTCGLSYIHYYKTHNEWIDPYKCCYEHHEFLDIKHKLWNLRKVKTLNWPHLDIIRNSDQYCEYATESRFARESLINFYSRFLKLSRLKNNKKLNWILDVTESFFHYGFAIPNDEYSYKCVCEDRLDQDKSCIMLDSNQIKIWYHDEPETEYSSCRYQKPHSKNKDLICDYIQRYYAKNIYTRRFSIRQNTEEIIKMQLTNEEFNFNGTPPYRLYELFSNRIIAHTSSVKCFENVVYFLAQTINYEYNQLELINGGIPMNVAYAMSTNKLNGTNKIVLLFDNEKVKIAIDMIIQFLIINDKHLIRFFNKNELDDKHIGLLIEIAKKYSVFSIGKLVVVGDLLQRYKLLRM